MTNTVASAGNRLRLKVPREDGAFLVQPWFSDVPVLIERNGRDFAASATPIHGRSLIDLRQAARDELLARAVQYTRDVLGMDVPNPDPAVVIATGHQPELFHPGVWVKHFAVSLLSSKFGTVGLNLVVDNDLMESAGIAVPAATRDKPERSWIDFDVPHHAAPWEEAEIRDQTCFESFGERIHDAMQPWGIQPLVSDMWPHAVSHTCSSRNISECLTAGRSRVERAWSLGNLELPMSWLCETDTLRWFIAHLLTHAPTLWEAYNQAVADYRRANHVRNASHPVPDLQANDGWYEVPLWIWKSGDATRQRLFVRPAWDQVHLSDRPPPNSVLASIRIDERTDSVAAIDELRQLSQQGFRIRTRALTTTMFARLFLADVFVHGIGGAKYDEITDRLLRRFFGIQPPRYVVLSATAWLPFAPAFPVTGSDVRRLRQRLRDMMQNAQRYLTEPIPASVRELVKEKEILILQKRSVEHGLDVNTRTGSGYARYRRLAEIRTQLAQFTVPEQAKLRDELRTADSRLAANQLLASREFSACLFPAERIHTMIAELRSLIDP